jgi:hypothetical protein
VRNLLLLFATIAACSGDAPGPPVTREPGPVARGPQLARVGTTSAVIAWLSSSPVIGAVEYGGGLEVADVAPTTEHVITLTDLAPGTLYPYRLRQGGQIVSEGHSFRTASDSGLLRFAVLGDSGCGCWPQFHVADRIAEWNPDLVIHTGDVVYPDGDDADLDPHYFVPYRGLIDRIPFYPSLGNHDVMTDDGRPLLEALYLPTNEADGSERFYSFDRSEVHFVALDSTGDFAPGSTQHGWVERDLARTTARWVFVYFHHPPYNSGYHGSDLDVRAHLCPLFEQHQVAIVFAGHAHCYERTLPMVEGKIAPSGPIYVITGGGGGGLHQAGTSSFTAFSESTHHHVQIEVDGSVLTLTAVRSDGTILDEATLATLR